MSNPKLGEVRTHVLGAVKTTAKKPATKRAAPAATTPDAVMPPRGQRGHFKMLTINIDPDLLDLLKDEKRNREKAGQTGVTVGGLISEAVVKAYGGK